MGVDNINCSGLELLALGVCVDLKEITGSSWSKIRTDTRENRMRLRTSDRKSAAEETRRTCSSSGQAEGKGQTCRVALDIRGWHYSTGEKYSMTTK
jgi:hypothetical protein